MGTHTLLADYLASDVLGRIQPGAVGSVKGALLPGSWVPCPRHCSA